jgi:hypothetical protein
VKSVPEVCILKVGVLRENAAAYLLWQSEAGGLGRRGFVMRMLRNLSMVALFGVWCFVHSGTVRADDLGCQGEDYYGQSDPLGPTFCGSEQDCCGYLADVDFEDTVDSFCSWYGEADWESSYWDYSASSNNFCDGFYVYCACTPPPLSAQ